MFYPIFLLNEEIYPLMGRSFSGDPYIFDFSSRTGRWRDVDVMDFDVFQREVFDELGLSGAGWGIGGYLEERRDVLRFFPQMIEEGRYYHAGLDIVIPGGSRLFAPLDGVVFDVGLEKGAGNYGGYVVLQHVIGRGDPFYTFWGHLDAEHRVKKDDIVLAGDCFAQLGVVSEHTGGWFTHTHLQVVTQRAVDENMLFKGYVSRDDLVDCQEYFPDPRFLLRW